MTLKHLGKAADGSTSAAYITPDHIDSSLLEAVPRFLNRTQYGIDERDLPFTGFDTWNCYEFSTLTNNGFPVSGLLRIVYPADSANIVESKSLKLYLNSFNMEKLGASVAEVMLAVQLKITKDLKEILGTLDVDVMLHLSSSADRSLKPFTSGFNFYDLESTVDVANIDFSAYNEDSRILQKEKTTSNIVQRWHSSSLRSNCKITNQPDWGDVYISIKGDRKVTPESLLQYIVSMRKENHFHEEICELIYKRLQDLLEPEELLVACLYTRRGGIDINPIRVNSQKALMLASNLINANCTNVKTMRQ